MVPVTDFLAENIFTQNIVDNLVVKSTEGRVQDHNRGGTVETPDINLELRTVLQSCIILGVLPGQTYSLPLTPWQKNTSENEHSDFRLMFLIFKVKNFTVRQLLYHFHQGTFLEIVLNWLKSNLMPSRYWNYQYHAVYHKPPESWCIFSPYMVFQTKCCL